MRSLSQLRLAGLCTALLLPVVAARAQEKKSDTLFTVEKYLDLEQVADPQISPDGSQIVYTRRYVNKLEDRFDAALWIMNADGSEEPLPHQGRRPALVARRNAHRVPRRRRAARARRSSCAGWTPRARRRRSRASTERLPISAGRPTASRSGSSMLVPRRTDVAHRHARGPQPARIGPPAAEVRDDAPLSAGPRRVHDGRLSCTSSSCRPTAVRRARSRQANGASARDSTDRPARVGVGLVARRQDDRRRGGRRGQARHS